MKSLSLRTLAMALTLSAILTSAAVAAWLAWSTWTTQRDLMQSQLVRVAETLSDSVDRELLSGLRKLQAITLDLPPEAQAAKASLHRRAKSLLSNDGDMQAIALNAADGFQIWNTRYPDRRAVVAELMAHESRALKRMEPLVSDLYEGRSAGDLMASYVVPLKVGGSPLLLVASIDVGAWAQRLAPMAAREGGLAALVDTNRRLVTRTADPERWLGQVPSDYWAPAFGERPAGLVRVVTREGVDAYGAWARLPQTGWTLLVAIPAGPWEQALLSGLATHLGLVALLVALGAVLAWWLGRTMVSGAQRLASSATQMVVDRKVEASPIGIREFETIRLGLVQAAERLRLQDERAEGLERSRNELLEKEQSARRDAEEANRFKDEFLGVLGHEMRSPLAAILHGAGALEHRVAGDARARSVAQAIQRQARALTRLVDDLLEVGRLMSGHVPLETTRIDLADVIRHAVEVLELGKATAEHRLEVSLESVEVDGDADRLQQVVINLLCNAVRYTPAGGSIRVALQRVERPWPAAELRIEDSGIGMQTEDLGRVFGLFVQAGHRDRHRRGLGIGLSVVKRVVERHHGRVWAESEGKGRGSTFVVQLPLA